MTWLYSILITGLLAASEGYLATDQIDLSAVSPPKTTEAVFDETEKFEQSYPLNPDGRVSVSNVNGSITIEAWDKNEVRLEATKFADTKEALAEIELDISSTSDRFSLEVDHRKQNRSDHKQWGGKRMEVQLRLSVPRTAVLDEIEAVNGSVSVSNFTNITKISAVNGEITATNLSGTAHLSTVNGTVKCDFERLDGNSRASLSTVNGQVSLTLPSDVSATVKADTLNGNITNDFGLRVRKGEYVGRDLYSRIGSGDVQIKLKSVNGRLAINRKNDGKSQNPVTDLLPDRNDGGSMAHNVNRSIDRSVRASQRQAEAAMRQAEKEIERIRPELEKIRIKELENLHIDIDVEKTIRDAISIQGEAMAGMRDAMWVPGLPTIEKKAKTFPVRGVPKVSIDAKICDVTVRGWDNPEVKYTLTAISRSREPSKAVVAESATESSISIKVAGSDPDAELWTRNNTHRLEVFVPRKANLQIITDGEIRVGGISGEIEVTGSNEAIDLRDVEGKLKIAADDAQVRLVGFSGDLVSQTANGPVYLDGDFTSIKSKSVSGLIALTLPAKANATVISNGSIRSERTDGVRENGGKWRFGTGSSIFNFNVMDGEVVVRDQSFIESK